MPQHSDRSLLELARKARRNGSEEIAALLELSAQAKHPRYFSAVSKLAWLLKTDSESPLNALRGESGELTSTFLDSADEASDSGDNTDVACLKEASHELKQEASQTVFFPGG